MIWRNLGPPPTQNKKGEGGGGEGLAKQPSQAAYVSDLKCWEASDTTTCGHKAKGIKPLIAQKKRKWWIIVLERVGKNKLWTCFKGNAGGNFWKMGRNAVGFSECIDTILHWTELICL